MKKLMYVQFELRTPFQPLHALLSLKIQQSCFAHKVTLAAHSMTLLPLKGIVSQGSLISAQNSAGYLCGKLSQPAKKNLDVF
jgi:hypothetical protein